MLELVEVFAQLGKLSDSAVMVMDRKKWCTATCRVLVVLMNFGIKAFAYNTSVQNTNVDNSG